MLRLSSKIIIRGAGGNWSFTSVNSVSILEDTEKLTDTCTIELPRAAKWQGAVGAGNNPPLRRGDRIEVWLGYNDKLRLRFAGYIRSVNTGVPVKIECEDGMFLLKTQEAEKKAFRNATLKQLITQLLADTGISHKLIDNDIVLGNYRITRDTVAQELAELQREYGLMAYFRLIDNEPILYVGFTYPFDAQLTESFIHAKNIIAEELEYRRAEDIKLKVKAVSVQADNKRIEVTVGDKDGELRSVYRYNIDRDALKTFATSELERFKFSGYQGSFTTFGEPAVRKTDKAHLIAQAGNEGKYLIKSVTIDFGMSGYRQKISLGPIIG